MNQCKGHRHRKNNAGGQPAKVCSCSATPTVLVAIAGDCPRVKHGRRLRHAASAFASSIALSVAMSTMAAVAATGFFDGSHQHVQLVSSYRFCHLSVYNC
jgi:hypothetical protein